MQVPPIVRRFYSLFPLYTYDDDESAIKSSLSHPTLWLAPPLAGASSSHLSGDIECLKWQTYLALRNVPSIRLRYDIQPDGGVGGVLPSLHLPNGDLLSPARIPIWADQVLNVSIDPLEGYRSEKAKDESRAWISLFEGVVHSALLVTKPPSTKITSLLDPSSDKSSTDAHIASFFQPPLAPVTGMSSLVPPYGLNIPYESIYERFKEAIESVSDRLGSDEWLLGSAAPTPLDAIVFAYLHLALSSSDRIIRTTVREKENLVLWERRVRGIVEKASSEA